MSYIKQHFYLIIATGSALIIGVVLGLLFLFFLSYTELFDTAIATAPDTDTQSDHEAYFRRNLSFNEVRDYLFAIAETEGAPAAFHVLHNNTLPHGIDSHLMGHFIGDIMYRQLGVAGLQYCTDDNGFACAHSVVINALLDYGDDFFTEVNQICEQAEGNNSYALCFHGFGHGVLAYAAYDLPQAIKDCSRVGTPDYNYHEEVECVGGIIMEMRGGIHDEILWENNGKKYLDPDNPIAMCQADYMPDKYKEYCYLYITPFIFDAFTQNDIPPPSVFEKAMNTCENADPKYQEACFGGFAKEFIGFILGRDIKLVPNMTDNQLEELWQSCTYTDNDAGRASCASYAVYNLYRSGAHPYQVPARYCSIIDESDSQSRCFHLLEQKVMETPFSQSYKTDFCAYIASNHPYTCHHHDDYVMQQ